MEISKSNSHLHLNDLTWNPNENNFSSILTKNAQRSLLQNYKKRHFGYIIPPPKLVNSPSVTILFPTKQNASNTIIPRKIKNISMCPSAFNFSPTNQSVISKYNEQYEDLSTQVKKEYKNLVEQNKVHNKHTEKIMDSIINVIEKPNKNIDLPLKSIPPISKIHRKHKEIIGLLNSKNEPQNHEISDRPVKIQKNIRKDEDEKLVLDDIEKEITQMIYVPKDMSVLVASTRDANDLKSDYQSFRESGRVQKNVSVEKAKEDFSKKMQSCMTDVNMMFGKIQGISGDTSSKLVAVKMFQDAVNSSDLENMTVMLNADPSLVKARFSVFFYFINVSKVKRNSIAYSM